MELTRKQELALIEIGLNTLLRGLTPNEVKTSRKTKKKSVPKEKKRTMSADARKAISRRMKKRWRELRKAQQQ